MYLEVDGVSFLSDNQLILSEISFSLNKSMIGCLLGPSGCGKTTLLRCIAGLESPVRGKVMQNNQVVNSPKFTVSPSLRKIGMVAQDLALFPHLTVGENISFPLKHNSDSEKKKVVNELLDLTNLGEHKNKFPYKLSGGEQKRVAIARALASSPELLLLDEPFSNLDNDMHDQLVAEVGSIIKDRNITALLVTHDQNEAFIFSEYCGVMSEGKLLQWGSCYQLYHQPNNRIVASFLGEGSFISGEAISDKIIETKLGKIPVPKNSEALPKVFDIYIRPDDIVYDPKGKYKLEVIHKEFRGAFILYTLKVDEDTKIVCFTLSHYNLEIGMKLPFRIEIQHLVIMK